MLLTEIEEMHMKYLSGTVADVPSIILFDQTSSHSYNSRWFNSGLLLGAGFATYKGFQKGLKCFGESLSVGLSSRPEDTELLNMLLFDNLLCYFKVISFGTCFIVCNEDVVFHAYKQQAILVDGGSTGFIKHVPEDEFLSIDYDRGAVVPGLLPLKEDAKRLSFLVNSYL